LKNGWHGSSNLTLISFKNPLIVLRPVTGSLPIKFETVINALGSNYLNDPYFLKMNLEFNRLVGNAVSQFIASISS
jgi:hypothetical protein